ncbi:MAG: antitoxin [Gammaproteobacteria bacterium]|nr:antitoxin [Gammaproteobacteria bacterium]
MNTKKYDYTAEELELLDYVENQNPESVANVEAEKEKHRQIFIDNATKRKQVSLRLLERDLYQLRTKALLQGVPYQTLISSVIHQYLNGELVSKNS